MLLFRNLLSEVTRPMPKAVGTSLDVQYKEKTCCTRPVLYFVALNGDTNIIVQSRSIQFLSL